MVDQNVDLTVGDILERAIEIEKSVADLYAVFIKRFSHVPGMSDFWSDLRRDEVGHMGELRVIYESLPEEKLCSTGDCAISASVKRVMESVEGKLLKTVRTLEDAYQIAYDLESSEVNAIFKYLTTDLVSPLSRTEIIDQVDEHEQKLEDFDRLYGDKNWRLQFIIQPE